MNRLDLLHHLFIEMKTAGGIDKHRIVSALPGMLQGVLNYLNGILGLLCVDLHTDLFSQNLELFDRRGADKVGGHQKRFPSPPSSASPPVSPKWWFYRNPEAPS